MRGFISVVPIILAVVSCGRAPASPAEQVEHARQEADRLHEKAIRLHGDAGKAEQIAALHRRSARMRPPSDPRAFQCYADAAQVLVAARKVTKARALIEESAEFALSRGDSVNAARAYAYAAMLAIESGASSAGATLLSRMNAVGANAASFNNELAALTAQVEQAAAKAEAEAAARAAVPSAARVPAR